MSEHDDLPQLLNELTAVLTEYEIAMSRNAPNWYAMLPQVAGLVRRVNEATASAVMSGELDPALDAESEGAREAGLQLLRQGVFRLQAEWLSRTYRQLAEYRANPADRVQVVLDYCERALADVARLTQLPEATRAQAVAFIEATMAEVRERWA